MGEGESMLLTNCQCLCSIL